MNNDLKTQQEEFKKKRQFTEAMQRARAGFANKDYKACGVYLQEALNLYPKDLDARELGADILLLNGKVKEAGKEYKAIYDEDNTRGKCEEKYAKCILAVFNSEQKLREMEAIMHGEPIERDKKSGYMTFLSCLIPGLGRIINEDYLIGVVVFVVYLIFIGMSVNSLNITSEGVLSLFTKPTSIVADIIWLGSMIDTINLFISNKK